MSYRPVRTELSDVFPELVDVALGRLKADMVVKGATLVNVFTGEFQEGVDIAVRKDRIALVGDASHAVGGHTHVIKADGLYACPGFIDAHVHVESAMITFSEFARAVVPRGTTAIFADPHEIANVLGMKGLRMVWEESRQLPLKVFLCVPSCVPASSPEFETAGAELTAKDIEEALSWPGVVALGEMMNYPGVLAKDEAVVAKLRAAMRTGKPIEGHSDGIAGAELNAYVCAGISSCHEAARPEEVAERLRLGMWAMIREGSAWKDLKACIRAITSLGLSPRRAVLVTDDRHPDDLLEEGHIDHVVRRAIEEGVDPVVAIQMATINPAEHFRLDHYIGAIGPGRAADIVLLSDLEKVEVDMVISDGSVVARGGVMMVRPAKRPYPEEARRTVRLRRPLRPEDFELVVKEPAEGRVKAHVIGVEEGKATTKHLVEEVAISRGRIRPSPEDDIALVAVVERHKATGNIGRGLVKGFGLKAGAAASTVAHDSHNLVVVGVNEHDMALAANALAEAGGGMAIYRAGRRLAMLELPIAGLISEEPVEVVAEKVKALEKAWSELGCTMRAPFMTLSLISLPVLPELRITDKGLVDTVEFKLMDVLAS